MIFFEYLRGSIYNFPRISHLVTIHQAINFNSRLTKTNLLYQHSVTKYTTLLSSTHLQRSNTYNNILPHSTRKSDRSLVSVLGENIVLYIYPQHNPETGVYEYSTLYGSI